MLKKIFFIGATTLFLFSDIHYAKIEPIKKITLKSEASGKVIIAKDNLEGEVVNGLIVKIDDSLDRIDLKNTQRSLKLIKDMIKLNSALLPELKKNMLKKERLYKNVSSINSTSISQKDSLYASFVTAKSQYFSTKEKILNLKNQAVSLEQKIASLRDKINKKNIKVNNKYLYSLDIKKGEFANIGMPLATLYDTSKAKLTIFLSDDELKDIDKKSIYLDGKKTNLKFSKIFKIADTKNISSYKAEIILNPVKYFSKLVKVEIK